MKLKKINGLFISGPLSLKWLQLASQQKASALGVALVIRFLEGVKKSNEFPLSQKWIRSFGIQKDSARIALLKLEKAGLVKVNRGKGRLSIVKIIELENEK